MIYFENIDYREFVSKLLADGVKVDAVITDMPYGVTANSWDKSINLHEFWDLMLQVSTDTASFILFSSGKFTACLMASNLDMYKYKYVWVKNTQKNFIHAKNYPMTKHEDILVFSKGIISHKATRAAKRRMTYNPQGLVEVNRITGKSANRFGNIAGARPSHRDEFLTTHTGYPSDVLHFDVVQNGFHPTQKPAALLEFLVSTHTNEGDKILDPFAGSGSTLLAGAKLGRIGYGSELHTPYYIKACETMKLEGLIDPLQI